MAAGEDDEVLNIRAELQNDISAPAEAAEQSIEELGDEAKRTARKLAALDAMATKTGNSLALLAVKRKAATMAFADEEERVAFLKDEFRRLTRVQDANTRSTNRQTKAMTKLGKATKKTRGELSGFLGFLKKLNKVGFKTIKIASLLGLGLAAIGLLVKAANVAPEIISIAGSLTSLLSIALLLPTAIASLIAIFATMKLAVNGVGAAIGAGFTGDAAKFHEAMKRLTPSARRFVKEVLKFKGPLKDLQKGIQENFFKPLAMLVAPTLIRLIPILRNGTGLLTNSLSELTGRFIKFLGTVEGMSAITEAFRSANRLVRALSNSLNPLMRGFSSLIVGSSAHWARFTNALERGLTRFGEWLTRISEDGTLSRWLDMAFETAKLLFDILGDVGRIFKALMVATDGQGLRTLSNFLDRVATWMESTQGQQAIVSFFQSLARAGEVLAPILTLILDSIANVLAPSIADLITTLAPGLVAFLTALNVALIELMPVWGPLGLAIGELLAAFIPILPVLAQITKILAIGLAGAFRLLAVILEPVLSVLLQPLLTLFTMIGIVLQQNQPYIERIVAAFAVGFAKLAPVLAYIAKLFMDRFLQFLPKLIRHWERMIPLLEKLATGFGEALLNALIALVPHLPKLIDSFFRLLELLTDPKTQYAMFTMLDIFVKLLPTIIALVPAMMSLANTAIFLLTIFLEVQAGMLAVFIGILNASINMTMAMFDIFSTIYDALTQPFEAAEELIGAILNGIETAIRRTFEGLANQVKSGTNFLNNLNPLDLFRAGGGPVNANQPYVVGEVGPERFIGNGIDKTIGANGPEMFTPPTSGMVVPHHLLGLLETAENYMQTALDAGKNSANEALNTVPSKTEHHTHNHYDQTFNMPIVNPQSEIDVKRAVKAAIKEAKEDDEERGR